MIQTTLFNDLKGYAGSTIGGKYGLVYVVNRTDDDPYAYGTLRWAIYNSTGAIWIVFDPAVFPPNTKTPIYLNSQLDIVDKQYITIDGRGSCVSLRRTYNWLDADWNTVNGIPQCNMKPGIPQPGPIVAIRSSKDIILTHLDFLQTFINKPPAFGEPNDQQCFGDAISIYNLEGTQTTKFFDNIWINHCTFRNACDECISVTRNSNVARGRVSVSNCDFGSSSKGILIGVSVDYQNYSAISIYNNRFVNINERSPRVQNQYSHMFNNVFDTYSYAIGLFEDGRAIVEDNAFMPDPAKPAMKKFTTGLGKLCQTRNFCNGQSIDAAYPNDPPYYPPSGHWLYDPAWTVPLTAQNYSSFVANIRANCGWKQVTNDIHYV